MSLIRLVMSLVEFKLLNSLGRVQFDAIGRRVDTWKPR